MSLTVLQEVHSSDLTASCLRARLLAHEGKRDATIGTALYRGQLWHAARRAVIDRKTSSNPFHTALVLSVAREEVRKEAGDALTDAKGLDEADAEVEKWLAEYIDRVVPTLGKIIGQEVPIRFTLNVDGEPQEFASHLDLVFERDGVIHVYDDKTGEDAPTRAYLERNYQFAMYAYGIRHGMVETDIGWLALAQWPTVSWVHVRHLKTYSRKTSTTDQETGEVYEYGKGDRRPLEKIVIPVAYTDADEGPIVEALSERVRMMRAGFWPANPSEVGCHLCECRRACARMGGNQ